MTNLSAALKSVKYSASIVKNRSFTLKIGLKLGYELVSLLSVMEAGRFAFSLSVNGVEGEYTISTMPVWNKHVASGVRRCQANSL
jgi:hypothetical protein